MRYALASTPPGASSGGSNVEIQPLAADLVTFEMTELTNKTIFFVNAFANYKPNHTSSFQTWQDRLQDVEFRHLSCRSVRQGQYLPAHSDSAPCDTLECLTFYGIGNKMCPQTAWDFRRLFPLRHPILETCIKTIRRLIGSNFTRRGVYQPRSRLFGRTWELGRGPYRDERNYDNPRRQRHCRNKIGTIFKAHKYIFFRESTKKPARNRPSK